MGDSSWDTGQSDERRIGRPLSALRLAGAFAGFFPALLPARKAGPRVWCHLRPGFDGGAAARTTAAAPLVELSLTQYQRRNRAAMLTQSELDAQYQPAGGSPALAGGDRVVVRTAKREYFSARVVDTVDRDGEHAYLIALGVRLPEEWALRRTGRAPGR